jgi:hypothetical protein
MPTRNPCHKCGEASVPGSHLCYYHREIEMRRLRSGVTPKLHRSDPDSHVQLSHDVQRSCGAGPTAALRGGE